MAVKEVLFLIGERKVGLHDPCPGRFEADEPVGVSPFFADNFRVFPKSSQGSAIEAVGFIHRIEALGRPWAGRVAQSPWGGEMAPVP